MGFSDKSRFLQVSPWEIVQSTGDSSQHHAILRLIAPDQTDLVDPAGPFVLIWCVNGLWIHHGLWGI